LKRIVLSGVLLVIVGLLAVRLSSQGNKAVSSTPFIALSSVPVPEMPAKAAELVSGAPVADREQTAREVLRAVATMTRSGVLPYVVSAICRSNPETAGTAVATAIALQPDDILVFSEAAIKAAPERMADVVVAACKADPPSFANVALVASRQMPSSNDLVLVALVRAIPGLDPFLEKAEIQVGTNNFEAVIKQTVQLVTDPSRTQGK
jgi:uncharacterized protein YbaA (DUF1428 family)